MSSNGRSAVVAILKAQGEQAEQFTQKDGGRTSAGTASWMRGVFGNVRHGGALW
jgi:hypothetical protein